MRWKRNNGPAGTAKETLVFARMLGFEGCTPPAYSPESNGMTIAFVKTFERDDIVPARLKSSQNQRRNRMPKPSPC